MIFQDADGFYLLADQFDFAHVLKGRLDLLVLSEFAFSLRIFQPGAKKKERGALRDIRNVTSRLRFFDVENPDKLLLEYSTEDGERMALSNKNFLSVVLYRDELLAVCPAGHESLGYVWSLGVGPVVKPMVRGTINLGKGML